MRNINACRLITIISSFLSVPLFGACGSIVEGQSSYIDPESGRTIFMDGRDEATTIDSLIGAEPSADEQALSPKKTIFGAPACTYSSSVCDTGSDLIDLRTGDEWDEPDSPNTIDGCPDSPEGFNLQWEYIARIRVETQDPEKTFGPGVAVTIKVDGHAYNDENNFDIYYTKDARAKHGVAWDLVKTQTSTVETDFIPTMTATRTLAHDGGTHHAFRALVRYGESAPLPAFEDNGCSQATVDNYADHDDLVLMVDIRALTDVLNNKVAVLRSMLSPASNLLESDLLFRKAIADIHDEVTTSVPVLGQSFLEILEAIPEESFGDPFGLGAWKIWLIDFATGTNDFSRRLLEATVSEPTPEPEPSPEDPESTPNLCSKLNEKLERAKAELERIKQEIDFLACSGSLTPECILLTSQKSSVLSTINAHQLAVSLACIP